MTLSSDTNIFKHLRQNWYIYTAFATMAFWVITELSGVETRVSSAEASIVSLQQDNRVFKDDISIIKQNTATLVERTEWLKKGNN